MIAKALRFSVVIPTCDRPSTLYACIQTVVAQSYDNLQILVQDNASDSRTREVVESFTDKRIVYRRLNARVSMRANFEAGLAAVDGEYIIFIGDDDGLSLGAISTLSEILSEDPVELVSWTQAKFFWSSISADAHGFLMLRFEKCFGKASRIQLNQLRLKFCTGKSFSPKTLGFVYHGCVSRLLIDRVRSGTSGIYFIHAIPDIYTAYANIFAARSGILVKHPLSIAGRSSASTGATFAKNASTSIITLEEFSKDNSCDPGMLDNCDVSVRSTVYLHYKCLKCVERFRTDKLNIDPSVWQHAIFRELAKNGENLGEAKAKLDHDKDFDLKDFQLPENVGVPKERTESRHEGVSPMRIYCRTERDGQDDVRVAQLVLDDLTGRFSPGKSNLSRIARMFRWLRALWRAVLLNRRSGRPLEPSALQSPDRG
jgi:Glycosyl transferase family 2